MDQGPGRREEEMRLDLQDRLWSLNRFWGWICWEKAGQKLREKQDHS